MVGDNDSSSGSFSNSKLMTRVAWLYYMGRLTQKEIGHRLGLSRVKVNRLLQRARNLGIIQISIQASDTAYVEQEQALCEHFGLRDAVVVTEADPGEPHYLALAQGVAEWLMPRLSAETAVGLGMGRTISHIPVLFKPEQEIGCTFVEITGGASNQGEAFANYNITSKMAELANGQASYIYAPTIVSSEATRDILLNEPTIAEALERARHCEIVVHSVGPVDESTLLYLHGHLDDTDLMELQARGAVGDALGHYYDADGQDVPRPLDRRIIGLTLEELRHIPWNVMVGGGLQKVEAIRGGIYGNLLNVLITDTRTAQALLEEESN